MKIDNSVFRYIEHELYNYDKTKKDLELYRENVLESTPFKEVSVQAGLGDPTASKAVKLSSSAFVINAENVLYAVDKALAVLGDRYRDIFKYKYQLGWPWQEVAVELDLSDRTYFRLRRELVAVVGQYMGLVDVS